MNSLSLSLSLSLSSLMSFRHDGVQHIWHPLRKCLSRPVAALAIDFSFVLYFLSNNVFSSIGCITPACSHYTVSRVYLLVFWSWLLWPCFYRDLNVSLSLSLSLCVSFRLCFRPVLISAASLILLNTRCACAGCSLELSIRSPETTTPSTCQ